MPLVSIFCLSPPCSVLQEGDSRGSITWPSLPSAFLLEFNNGRHGQLAEEGGSRGGVIYSLSPHLPLLPPPSCWRSGRATVHQSLSHTAVSGSSFTCGYPKGPGHTVPSLHPFRPSHSMAFQWLLVPVGVHLRLLFLKPYLQPYLETWKSFSVSEHKKDLSRGIKNKEQ